MLTAVDLFAGCGGLTLGLKTAGFTILGAVEVDDLAAETYTLNHPEVELWHQDIRGLTAAALKRRLGIRKSELDLLAGCPPCQGFSRLRSLNGRRRVREPQNDLVFEFTRFVEELLPRAVMLENVPGLRESYRWRKVLRTLKRLGYEVNSGVLDAADFGVPQRRRRLIVLAARDGRVEFARKARAKKTVAHAIRGLPHPRHSRDKLHAWPEKRAPHVAELLRHIPKNGGSRRDLPREHRLLCHIRCDGFHDVYGRMRWGDVAPTITSGCVNPSKGRFIHPEHQRCISLREAALLQSFPPRYRFSTSRGKFAIAEMIGNALPPEFVRRHAVRIKARLLRQRKASALGARGQRSR